MREPDEAVVPAGAGPSAGMFGDEGQQVLDSQGPGLFPVAVRPAFFRLMWAVLAALAVAAAAVALALAGNLR